MRAGNDALEQMQTDEQVDRNSPVGKRQTKWNKTGKRVFNDRQWYNGVARAASQDLINVQSQMETMEEWYLGERLKGINRSQCFC